MTKPVRLAAVAILALVCASGAVRAEERSSFRIAWSIYVGWMPWGYIAESGIMERWADREGIEVELVRQDYLESLENFASGAVDGVSATNMDTLAFPVAAGRDTTVVVIGDHSSGNDAVLLKEGETVADLAGKRLGLVTLSVSHYLLSRALDAAGLTEADVELVDVSDAEMAARFDDPDLDGVVTWNPIVADILARPGVANVYDSADIPGEIMDLMVVDSAALEANPALGRALAGAWYEAMRLMASPGPDGVAARRAMAEAAGTDLEGYEAQLYTTRMFYDPAEAAFFANYDETKEMNASVVAFLGEKGLLGEGVAPREIGISYPDGTVTGDPANVLLRFDDRFMAGAAAGEG